MKRLTRRTLAIVMGLGLGWWVAGLAPQILPGVEVSFADQNEHAHSNEGNSVHGEDSAASELVPEKKHAPFFKPVLGTIVGLFIAAVVLGIPALKLRGPEPPDPAAAHEHDDQHEQSGQTL